VGDLHLRAVSGVGGGMPQLTAEPPYRTKRKCLVDAAIESTKKVGLGPLRVNQAGGVGSPPKSCS